MLVLADTNILVRLFNQNDPQYRVTVSALNRLSKLDSDICVAPQNIVESWNTATRPVDRNGMGIAPFLVEEIVTRIEGTYQILPESPDVYPLWRKLVAKYSVSGVKVYDTRLVASAVVYGVESILTFNIADFRRYSEIKVLDPKTI